MHFERGRRQRHGPQAPWRTCRNAKNFTIFEEEPLCFNMRLNYKISTRVILIFLPLYLPSSSTLLMGAGAVYFIKILHQHFDDNDLWKKWFNFSCNNSSRAGTWNLQQDCHKEAYMIPSSKASFRSFGSVYEIYFIFWSPFENHCFSCLVNLPRSMKWTKTWILLFILPH